MASAKTSLSSRSPDAQALAAAPARPGLALQPLITAIAAVAALYFGADIFIPLALALLVTFALSPVVSFLRRWRIPRVPAVILAVLGALVWIVVFLAIVATQLGTLADNLPNYQYNLTQKVRSLRDMNVGEGIIERATRVIDQLGREMEGQRRNASGLDAPTTLEPPAAEDGEEPEREPIPVVISQPAMAPLTMLTTFVVPLIEPIATIGIVIVVVIFMLIRREDLRDRFIRLVGSHDMQRTTTALQDAGRRVGQYLLMQLVVNVTYAIPIGVGLWLIGVPNAALWALMCLVLRFIPYIGPIVGAMFPLALSIAVAPGWSLFLWTAALFVTLELISNNFIEPLLYGSRTGMSPVAVILSAIFWTWLWGPVGLLLSTPLTVCLVVLGRHVPQFHFLDVLLGNEPVLSPSEQLYQRLIAGNPEEATERAEELLRDLSLVSFYDTVAMATLKRAEEDRSRGVLDDLRRERVAEGIETLVENLEDHEDGSVVVEEDEDEDEVEARTETEPAVTSGMPVVAVAGGRGNLDDAAASLMADLLERAGSEVTLVGHDELSSARTMRTDLADRDVILVSYLNDESSAHARYLVRRLRRQRNKAVIVVGFWREDTDAADAKRLRDAVKCDHVVQSLGEALALLRDIGAQDRIEEAVETDREEAPKRKPAPRKAARAKAPPKVVAEP